MWNKFATAYINNDQAERLKTLLAYDISIASESSFWYFQHFMLRPRLWHILFRHWAYFLAPVGNLCTHSLAKVWTEPILKSAARPQSQFLRSKKRLTTSKYYTFPKTFYLRDFFKLNVVFFCHSKSHWWSIIFCQHLFYHTYLNRSVEIIFSSPELKFAFMTIAAFLATWSSSLMHSTKGDCENSIFS